MGQDSTFWTKVGRPPTPRSRTGWSPTNEGTAGSRPLMALTAADSCPARNRSGATMTSMGHGSSALRLRSLMAAVITRAPSAGTNTCARDAPRVLAARTAPSSTRWGSWWTRKRSLLLAGSPSAPFATTRGVRSLVLPTERHLVPTGNQAPPCPRRPLASSSSMKAGPSQCGDPPPPGQVVVEGGGPAEGAVADQEAVVTRRAGRQLVRRGSR